MGWKYDKTEDDAYSAARKERERVEVDLSALRPMVELTGHTWRQEGPCLICSSCQLQHAAHIGMDKIFSGYDATGAPLFKNR